MKILKFIPALALTGLMASTAIAAPNTIVGSDSISIGGAATIDLTFQADGTVAGLDYTFSFDDTQFTPTPACVASLPTTGAAASVVCSVVGSTIKVLVSAPLAFPVPTIVAGDQSLGSISFQSNGDTPVADYALTITEENYFDINAAAVTPTASTDGNITVNAGPQPAFGVTNAPVDISGQVGAGTIVAGVTIDNTGEANSTLNYTCTETADSDNKFTIGGDITNIDLAVGDQGFPSVACDRTVVGGPFTGNMQCTHNGSNTSPVDIGLTCNISAGPQAMFSGTPTGLAMVAVEQGDADPTGSVAITNTGDATTTVAGTCTLTGPDAQITVSNGAFSVDEGAAAHVVAVSCDASAEGIYANTLSCAHDGANATPVDFAVSCDVGPPGPSVYASVPAAGSTIEMTPDGDVPMGATVADQVLTITNDAAEANDAAMGLSCAWAGSAEITVTAPTGPVAAQASTSATFSCSTAAVGAYTGTYTCNHGDDGDELLGSAAYTVNCGVRAAASDILEDPVSGTALSILVPINGSGSTSVSFAEILDEGVDATIDSCSFGTAIFSVVTALPADVLAGGSTNVEVTGSDPATGEISFTDTLTCTYTDSDSAPGTASWPVTLTVLAQPIPTLSVWGLMLMILTLMGLGGMVIRSRVHS